MAADKGSRCEGAWDDLFLEALNTDLDTLWWEPFPAGLNVEGGEGDLGVQLFDDAGHRLGAAGDELDARAGFVEVLRHWEVRKGGALAALASDHL